MSCGSCSSCNCNPCTCDETCDPNNEPLASALNNFIASFFGSIGKTCVDNQVQWILPCDLNTGLAGFERRQGEGVACYLLRLFEYLNSIATSQLVTKDEGVIISNATASFNFTGAGVVATAAGNDITVTIPGAGCADFYNKIAINGVCYDTWQAAYDANVGATTPTLMLVGQGSTFGNLVLTGNYNSNIIPVGFGVGVSQLGTITGAGFTVVLTAHELTMGAITSSGAVITLSGSDTVFGAVTSTNAAGVGGAISLASNLTSGALSSNGTTGGGNITVGSTCSTSSLDARATVSGNAGNVVIGVRSTITGNVTTSGIQNGGDITTGAEVSISGNLDLSSTTGTSISGFCTLGRETSCGNITSTSGFDGDFVVLGNECTVGNISTISTGASGSGTSGPVIAGDDCVIGNINAGSTVAGTGGNDVTVGDRCEVGTITTAGQTTGGGNVTTGNDCKTSAIDARGIAGANGGAISIGRRCTITGTIDTTGTVNGGVISIGSNTIVTSTITGTGTGGTSGPITIESGGSFGSIVASSSTSTGAVTIGKFCVTGGITTSSSGTVSTLTIGDGSTIQGTITMTGTSTGAVTIGNAVTITGDLLATCTTGTSGGITTGTGCNVQKLRCFKTIGNAGAVGNIVLGAGSISTELHAGTSGGVGSTAGSVTMGSGSVTGDIWAASFAAGGNSGSVVLEPGATCATINVNSVSGTGGNVTLKNANMVVSSGAYSIAMGSSSTGTIKATNARITDQIDNVNGTSIFINVVGSTAGGNRDFIANVTANGSEYIDCLIVPNGTGLAITAGAARTIIAYNLRDKNGLGVNVTLSEGNEITSANFVVP